MVRVSPRSVFLPAAFSLCATVPVAAQSYFTAFGSGCDSGSGATPAIGMTGLPVLGQVLSIDVSSAPPNAPAWLEIGASNQSWLGIPLPFDLGLIGITGCTLLISPDITVAFATNSAGSASIPAAIPVAPALLGAQFYNQWLVLTPAGTLALSNGGCGTVSDFGPASITSVSPPAGPVGTVVTVRGFNFGRNNPDDLCLRVMDPRGDSSLLRPTAISFDALTGEDVITATLITASELQPPVVSSVGIMRGFGLQPVLAPTPSLSATSSWGWRNTTWPGESALGGTFTALPQAALANSEFHLVGNRASATLPLDPFGNGGTYPVGIRIRVEIHIHYASCRWFDLIIDLGSTSFASALAMSSQIGNGMLQSAIDQVLGAGVMQVTTNGPTMDITLSNPAFSFDEVGGHVIIG